MAYQISLLPAARRQFARLDPAGRRRVGELIDSLSKEPRPAGVKALKGMPGLLRVLVVALGHCREVYRSL